VIDTKNKRISSDRRDSNGYDPEKSEVEIGWTFLASKYWAAYNAKETINAGSCVPVCENVVSTSEK